MNKTTYYVLEYKGVESGRMECYFRTVNPDCSASNLWSNKFTKEVIKFPGNRYHSPFVFQGRSTLISEAFQFNDHKEVKRLRNEIKNWLTDNKVVYDGKFRTRFVKNGKLQ